MAEGGWLSRDIRFLTVHRRGGTMGERAGPAKWKWRKRARTMETAGKGHEKQRGIKERRINAEERMRKRKDKVNGE